jgi:hypothetical protein
LGSQRINVLEWEPPLFFPSHNSSFCLTSFVWI